MWRVITKNVRATLLAFAVVKRPFFVQQRRLLALRHVSKGNQWMETLPRSPVFEMTSQSCFCRCFFWAQLGTCCVATWAIHTAVTGQWAIFFSTIIIHNSPRVLGRIRQCDFIVSRHVFVVVSKSGEGFVSTVSVISGKSFWASDSLALTRWWFALPFAAALPAFLSSVFSSC